MIERYSKKEFVERALDFARDELNYMMSQDEENLSLEALKALEIGLKIIENTDHKSDEDLLVDYLDVIQHSDHYWTITKIPEDIIILLSLIYKVYGYNLSCMSYTCEYSDLSDELIEEILFIESDFFDFAYWDDEHVKYICNLISKNISSQDRYSALCKLHRTTKKNDAFFREKLKERIDSCEKQKETKINRKMNVSSECKANINRYLRQINEIEKILPIVREKLSDTDMQKKINKTYLFTGYTNLFNEIMDSVALSVYKKIKFSCLECGCIMINAFNNYMKRTPGADRDLFLNFPKIFEEKVVELKKNIKLDEKRMKKRVNKVGINIELEYVMKSRLDWQFIFSSPGISDSFRNKYLDLYTDIKKEMEKYLQAVNQLSNDRAVCDDPYKYW